jgi:hypothetical protein
MKLGKACAGPTKTMAAIKLKHLDRPTSNRQNIIGKSIKERTQRLKS